MSAALEEAVDAFVREQLSEEVRDLIAAASFDLYVDADDCVSGTEPEAVPCEACGGDGRLEGETVLSGPYAGECGECGGGGAVVPEYRELDDRYVRRIVLGKLAEYCV